MIIIEGADCTGKTTLAKRICEEVGGQYFHCSYHPKWNVEAYHRLIGHTAGKLEEQAGVPTVIDRFAMSEAAYGLVYRNGPSYDTAALMQEMIKAYKPTFIFCRTESAAEDHKRIQQTRSEMFDDITEVVNVFDELASSGKYGVNILYDYKKHDTDYFIKAFASYA
jgi:thymidylate kinase